MEKSALGPDFLEQMRHAGDRFRVMLVAAGDRTVDVMAVLRGLLACSLAEARTLVDKAPVTIRDDMPRGDALELQAALERRGATIALGNAPPEEPPQVPPQVQDELLLCVSGGHWRRVQVVSERVGPAGRFELGIQPCGKCGQVGTLVSGLSEGVSTCPRCHATELAAVGGWAT